MKNLLNSNGRPKRNVLPRPLRQVGTADQIPVMDDRQQKILAKLTLAVVCLSVGFLAVGLGLVMVALRPVPDLVVDGERSVRVQPLQHGERTESELITRFLEARLPLLYTWVGLRPNPKDPTGTTFIKDAGVSVNTDGGSVKIPTSVWNEQFILAEEIRQPTLDAIAELIRKTGSQIWQTDPSNPGIGISYRFVFSGRPQYPKEVEPGRWRVVVNGHILKFMPTLIGPPTNRKLQELNLEVYVRRAARNPVLAVGENADGDGTDLIAHGKSSGYEIEAMLPYRPDDETLPSPKFKEPEDDDADS